MKKDLNKTKEQLSSELNDLRNKSKEREEILRATNQQLDASNQQLSASEQQLSVANQQLIADEHELKKEKIFSEKIIETADAVIVGIDKDHLIRIFNKGAERITGYTKAEVIGKDWFKLFFPAEILDEMNKIWKNSWGITSHSYVNPILSKAGKEIIVSWQTTGMYENEDVSKHLLLSVGEDITERINIQKALQESESLYHDLVETAQDLIWQCDAEGKYTYLNPEWEKVFGCKIEEMLGKKFTDFQTREWADKDLKEFERLLAGNTVKGLETVHLAKDGKEINLIFNAKFVSDENGKIVGTRGTAFNITESKKAEETLKRSEYLLSETQQISKIGGWEYDIESGESYFSDEVFSIYGTPKNKQFEPEEGLKFYHPDDQPLISDAFIKAISDGVPYDLEIRFINAQGKNLWVKTAGKPVSEKGKLVKVLGTLMDITDRKLSEAQLIESNKRYKAFISVSDTGAWEYNTETDFLWCSPEYFSMLGHDRNQFDQSGVSNLNESWIDLLHPEDRKRARTHFGDYLKNGSVSMYENYFRMQHSDGHWVWILSRGSTLRDENGNITNLTVGTHINITAQKQAEEKIKISHQKLTDILENMSDAFVALDRNWCYTQMNKKAGKMFNRDAKEMIGKHIWTEFPEDVGQPFHLNYEKAMIENVFIKMEEYYLPYDKWFENRINPTEDGIAIFFTDTTEHKKAEKALTESEEKYRALAETSSDIIMTLDNEGKYTYISPAAEKITGYRAQEFINHPFIETLASESVQPTIENFKIGLTGKKIPLYEIEILHKDGNKIPVELNASNLFDDKGNVIGRLAVARDIRERKIAEEELAKYREHLEELVKERTKELEVKNKELERFNNLFVNREFRIKELRDKVAELEKKNKLNK